MSNLSEKEITEILNELKTVRPEKLTGEAKRLFEAIMKIADERDELLKERQADKEKIKELEEIEKIHQEENGELRKEINEENKRCMILAVENQDLKEKRISKDKMIDLMAFVISSYDGQLVINQYKDRNEVKAKFKEYVEDGTYEQYFENLAKESGEIDEC